MIMVKFEKQRAQEILKCLQNGEPIKPAGPDGWSGNDALALAGACYFMAMSQGPQSFWLRDIAMSRRTERNVKNTGRPLSLERFPDGIGVVLVTAILLIPLLVLVAELNWCSESSRPRSCRCSRLW